MPNICPKCYESHSNCQCKPDNKVVWEPEEEVQELSLMDYMQICSLAVELSDNVTTMSKEDDKRKSEIKRMCFEITHAIISDLHGSYFTT